MSGDQQEPASDARLDAPASARNRDPILDVLRRVLPAAGLVCEVASGTGQHVIHFATALPALVWQPTDPDANMRASISAWITHANVTNVRSPLALDARSSIWPIAGADAVICINMVHISPWDATLGLIQGASRLLRAGGVLFLYGPYRQRGRTTAPSNEAFDAALRARDPDWGLRELETVVDAAGGWGFELDQVVAMPANNLSVILRKLAPPLGDEGDNIQ